MKRIVVEHPGPCLSCEEIITRGESANWEPKIGIWHEKCPEPKNLQFYIRARDRNESRSQGELLKENAALKRQLAQQPAEVRKGAG